MTKKFCLMLIILLSSLLISAQTEQDTSKLVDIINIPRGIFYHISYSGGPKSGKKSQYLSWFTHKELPHTYFIVEHFIWNKWIQRDKVIPKSRPGRPQYSGEIIGKYSYHIKLPPHSGLNKWRVLLMNDSNVCIGVSKVLEGIDEKGAPLALIYKVSYTNKKNDKEIIFSSETYYELYDASGKLVDKGNASILSYVTLEKGDYTLYYDNTTTNLNLK